MKIETKMSYGSIDVIITADNVKIQECVTQPIFGVKPDGKKDYSIRLGNEVETAPLRMFTDILEVLIYYRIEDFDSCELIHRLFDKLPEEKKAELVDDLKETI